MESQEGQATLKLQEKCSWGALDYISERSLLKILCLCLSLCVWFDKYVIASRCQCSFILFEFCESSFETERARFLLCWLSDSGKREKTLGLSQGKLIELGTRWEPHMAQWLLYSSKHRTMTIVDDDVGHLCIHLSGAKTMKMIQDLHERVSEKLTLTMIHSMLWWLRKDMCWKDGNEQWASLDGFFQIPMKGILHPPFLNSSAKISQTRAATKTKNNINTSFKAPRKSQT